MTPADTYAPPDTRRALAVSEQVRDDVAYIRQAVKFVEGAVNYIKEKRMEVELTEPERPRVDPIVAGLLDHMPRPGSVWPAAQRKQFIALLEGAFELIYKDGTGVST